MTFAEWINRGKKKADWKKVDLEIRMGDVESLINLGREEERERCARIVERCEATGLWDQSNSTIFFKDAKALKKAAKEIRSGE